MIKVVLGSIVNRGWKNLVAYLARISCQKVVTLQYIHNIHAYISNYIDLIPN